MAKQLLDLTTKEELPVIRIDGQTYPFYSLRNLQVLQYQRLRSFYSQVQQFLGNQPDVAAIQQLTDEQVETLLHTMQEMVCIIIPDIPQEVQERLAFGHYLQILQTFADLSGIEQQDLEDHE